MNREWIGIAADLTENGVVGTPYQAPAAAHPQAPANGRLKTIAVAGAVLAAFAWWLPPRHIDAPDAPDVPASAAATAVTPAPAAPAPASAAAHTAHTARRSMARPPAPAAPAQPDSAGQAAAATPADAETATEINLDHYRSLTRGL